jgi:superfamily II DNA helicase RecQ
MELLVFVAPPAFGKTAWLQNYIQGSGWWIFVSPLRALALEVKRKNWQVPVYSLWENPSEWERFNDEGGLLVTTPEKLSPYLEALIDTNSIKPIIIWDEWHLNECWGESFRPYLLEVELLVLNLGFPMVALTATLDQESYAKLQSWQSFISIQIIDFGNFILKNKPASKICYLPSYSDWLNLHIKRLLREPRKKILIFVRYRSQVDEWLDYCRHQKIQAIGCKGGETEVFVQELIQATNLQVIVTTTVLSHGVNLPPFTHVVLTYQEKSDVLWLQMVARGGRRGEPYQLIEMRKSQNKKDLFVTWGKGLIWVIVNTCKLKELSSRQWIIKNVTWWLKF